MFDKLVFSIREFIAPGAENAKKAEIKMIFKKNGSFRVDMKSFRHSAEVKRQIEFCRSQR